MTEEEKQRKRLKVATVVVLLVLAQTVASKVNASPLEYPFHATKVVNTRSGYMTTGGTWSPTPYNKTAVLHFGSRNAAGRTFAQKAIRLGPAAIKNAARLRMLGPAGLALGTALTAYDIVFNETTETFETSPEWSDDTFLNGVWSYDVLSAPGTDYTQNPVYQGGMNGQPISMVADAMSDFVSGASYQSSFPTRTWEYTGVVAINPHCSDSNNPRFNVEAVSGGDSAWLGVAYVVNRFDFKDAYCGKGNPEGSNVEWEENNGGTATDEALYDALDNSLNDGTGTGSGTWNNFFTDPLTGQPLDLPEFDQAAQEVTDDYNAWEAQNTTDQPVPDDTEDTVYQQDDDFQNEFDQPEQDSGSGSDICSENPDALACLGVGTELSSQDLQDHEIGFDFTPVALSSGGATCPAPITVGTGIGSIELSYDGACTAAGYMAPIIPIFGAFAALLIIVGMRNE